MSAAANATPVRFDDRRRLAALRLIRSENVGPATFTALIRRFGDPETALAALPDLSRRGGSRRAIRIASPEEVEGELARAERFGAHIVVRGETEYPASLLDADGAPPIVTLMGATAAFEKPAVAIVGSRNASVAGSRFCAQISMELGQTGFVVVSGLARGIDTAAHKASLTTGTIGVFAGGLDRPYPDENRPLMRQIVDAGGGLISEMPFGWAPRATDFPRRNRIIAALALGLLVVEAAPRSGSLISARYAGDLGRLVFAVPGSPLDPRAAGTNQLLKDGAILVTEACDVVDALQPLRPRTAMGPVAMMEETDDPYEDAVADGDVRSAVVAALGPAPTLLDDLVAHLGVPIGSVQSVLLELDLAGRLERHPGARVSLLP